jgi:hypothetical protein
MRDNHDKLPELLATRERNGQYFGVVRIDLCGEARSFELGVTAAGHSALAIMMSQRPFDSMPGVPYRYFFVPSVRCQVGELETQTRQVAVRVELRRKSKDIEVSAPIDLIQNLMWFFQVKSFEEARMLNELKEGPTRASLPALGAFEVADQDHNSPHLLKQGKHICGISVP